MRLQRLISITIALVLVAGVAPSLAPARPVAASSLAGAPALVRVTNVTDSSFTVTWFSYDRVSGAVNYRPAGGSWQSAPEVLDDGSPVASSRVHSVFVRDLSPDTPYEFQIVSGGVPYDDYLRGGNYLARTGPVLQQPPTPTTVFGRVTNQAADGDLPLVFARVRTSDGTSTELSARAASDGYWAIGLSTARRSDLTQLSLTSDDSLDLGAWESLRRDAYHTTTVGAVADSTTDPNAQPNLALGTAAVQRRALPLQAGWNLVSVDLEAVALLPESDLLFAAATGAPTDTTIGSVLKPLLDRGWYVQAESFDGAARSYYSAPAELSALGDLATLDAVHGYWVYVDSQAVLAIDGRPLASPQISLREGWNLVSYLGTAPASPQVALGSLGTALTDVLGYDGAAVLSYRPGDAGSTLTVMEPGKGYWIKVSGAIVLDYTPVIASRTGGDSSFASARVTGGGARLALALLGGTDSGPPRSAVAAQVSPSAPQYLNFSNIQDVAFTVFWFTDQPTTGAVSFGPSPAGGQIANDKRGASVVSRVHYVEVSGLQPGTDYHVAIMSGGQTFRNPQGQPYLIKTGPTFSSLPMPESVYGKIVYTDGRPAAEAIVSFRVADSDGRDSPAQSALMSLLISPPDQGAFIADIGNARVEPNRETRFQFTFPSTPGAPSDNLVIEARYGPGGNEGVGPIPVSLGRMIDTNNLFTMQVPVPAQSAPPTNTPVPPTATHTPIPTNTPPPVLTNTPVPQSQPTNTPVPAAPAPPRPAPPPSTPTRQPTLTPVPTSTRAAAPPGQPAGPVGSPPLPIPPVAAPPAQPGGSTGSPPAPPAQSGGAPPASAPPPAARPGSPPAAPIQGAVVQLPDGQASITFPPKAIDRPVRASIKVFSVGERGELVGSGAAPTGRFAPPPGLVIVGGRVYEITAADAENGSPVTRFGEDVVLTFRYDPTQLGGVPEASLTVHVWEDNRWAPLSSWVDSANRSVNARTSHLSLFAILGQDGRAATTVPAVRPPAEGTASSQQPAGQGSDVSQPSRPFFQSPIVGFVLATAIVVGVYLYAVRRSRRAPG